jgi:uncharacterized protein YfaS (alpha-2-macroglobulin family)
VSTSSTCSPNDDNRRAPAAIASRSSEPSMPAASRSLSIRPASAARRRFRIASPPARPAAAAPLAISGVFARPRAAESALPAARVPAAAASRAARALAAAPTGAADSVAAPVDSAAFEVAVDRAERARGDAAFERLAVERERPDADFDRDAVDPERGDDALDLLDFELDRLDADLDRPLEFGRLAEPPLDFDRDLLEPLVRCAIGVSSLDRFRADRHHRLTHRGLQAYPSRTTGLPIADRG